jgi:Phage tail sheath protein.
MALGGGTWIAQNKKLPGAYINFVSANRATSLLSERGIAAMPLILNWGIEGEVFKVTNEDFEENALKIFGYDYANENLANIRDLFLNAKTLYAYRLGTGTKATCKYCTAKYSGTRGNDLKIVVTTNEIGGFNIKTMLDNSIVDSQDIATENSDDEIPAVIAKINSLKDNDFVSWTNDISIEAGTISLSGGTNSMPTTENYSEFLKKIEPYAFNTIGCTNTTEAVKKLFVAFTKRMRDECGVKIQCVLHKYEAADYEGIISVANNTDANLVYWTTGASAGCEINKSNTNKIYNGEFAVDTDFTQTELENALACGKFIFHKVGDDVRVLEDINTLVTTTAEKGEDFKYNQTVRVLDQIANDIATIFNTKYLGVIPNDESGRISLWNDIVKHHQELQNIHAIENFQPDNVTVSAGNTKKAVVVLDKITPTNCMAQLYMQCIVE